MNALHLAARHNRAVYCDLLVKQGFDAQKPISSTGQSAVDLAESFRANSALHYFSTGEVRKLREESEKHELDQLRSLLVASVERISQQLKSYDTKLTECADGRGSHVEEQVFDLAKQIRLAKLALNSMSKDGLI